jgi:nucleoside-diphosphate-sugar epimerase
MFDYFSRQFQIPMAILRLNYATELRYGVLVDIAAEVQAQRPVDVSMGYVNVIWQADANAMGLAAFAQLSSPAKIINIAGPDILRVRDVGETFGKLLGKAVRFAGVEGESALLNNGRIGHQLLGSPRVGIDQIFRWTADWVAAGGESHGKPTHFQSRDGKF